MRKLSAAFIYICLFFQFFNLDAQYQPTSSAKELKKAHRWVDKKYASLTQEEKLGQLFIVALYTNKGEDYIQNVRKIVAEEKIGGLILMQEDAEKEIKLVNEFQKLSKIPLLVGMDAEWGLYQRINTAYKFPWAMTLGAIQDKRLIKEMAQKIADDCKKMGIYWDFAPVVDVNTNPNNPIIGNRSFGSNVDNVIQSAEAYAEGLQSHGVLAAIKHFPGHGDTDVDSHSDLPTVSHSVERLNKIELKPFKGLIDNGIGGIMVAHLYVPALEKEKNTPASISKSIVTDVLKNQFGYKGLIITDALNMGAVAKRYAPGELNALAFKAGNDLMLFSEGVKEGKKRIQQAIDQGEIYQKRVEESVKKILLTKYFLGLKKYHPIKTKNINQLLNTPSHQLLGQKLYANALTLLQNNEQLLPLNKEERYYYVPLEEAPYDQIIKALEQNIKIIVKPKDEISTIPSKAKVIIGLHKDISSAYSPYQISEESKTTIQKIAQNHPTILTVLGSPYALKDLDISSISTVLLTYENNDDSMKATAEAILGNQPILGKLPVDINHYLPSGKGMVLPKKGK